MKIYLAGPMSTNSRVSIDLGQATEGEPVCMASDFPSEPAYWRQRVMQNAPFHEYYLPEMLHDEVAQWHGHDRIFASEVVPGDISMVRESDLVLAYIDSSERYGTFAEIAAAYALGKKVVAAHWPGVFRNNWFVHAMITESLQFERGTGMCRDLGPLNQSEAVYLLSAFAKSLPPTTFCSRCGKMLTDHESVRSGLGPRCAAVLGRSSANDGNGIVRS